MVIKNCKSLRIALPLDFILCALKPRRVAVGRWMSMVVVNTKETPRREFPYLVGTQIQRSPASNPSPASCPSVPLPS